MRAVLFLLLLCALVFLLVNWHRDGGPAEHGLMPGSPGQSGPPPASGSRLNSEEAPSVTKQGQREAPSLDAERFPAGGFPLVFVHAEDGSPLGGLDFEVLGQDTRYATDSQGACHLTGSAPEGTLVFLLDLDGDGEEDLRTSHAVTDQSPTVQVPGVITLRFTSEEPLRGDLAIATTQIMKRSSGAAIDPAQPPRAALDGDAFPWTRFAEERLSDLSAWMVVLRSAAARDRIPIRAVGGTQDVSVEMRYSSNLRVVFGSPAPLAAKVRVIPIPGQNLDMVGVRQNGSPNSGMNWNELRSGRYQIVVQSLSHEPWKHEFEIERDPLLLHPDPIPSPVRTMTGSFHIPKDSPASWIQIELYAADDDRDRFTLPFVVDEPVGRPERQPFSFQRVRDVAWVVRPYANQAEEGPMLRFDPPYQVWGEGPLEFRVLAEAD